MQIWLPQSAIFFALCGLESRVIGSQLEWKQKQTKGSLMIHDTVSTDVKDVQILNWPPTLDYRVSHSKPGKVILLWWRYILWFLLIFWILRVHEKGTFMQNSPVFNFLMLSAIYGSISQNILFLNKFWIILTFRVLFQKTKNNNP